MTQSQHPTFFGGLGTRTISTFNTANRNFQHCKSKLSTLQIATFNIAYRNFNITNRNLQRYKSQLLILQMVSFNITNRNLFTSFEIET